jgi:hypothetical protein
MNNVTVSDHTRDVSINTRKATVINTYLNTNSASSVDFITSDSADISYGAIVNVDGTDFVVNYMMFNSPEPGLLTVRASGAVFETSTQYTFVFEPTSTNEWRFETNGKIYGPGEDGALVLGGELVTENVNMSIKSNSQSVVLNGALGEFLGSSDDADSQIATIGDISNAAPVETEFTVNGGSLGTMPTFNGDPLFSGTYVKTGPLVHFQIQVDMDNITNFGTGQYYVDLPFPAKYGYQVREGCLHDISADKQYAIGGHVFAGESRLNLFFTDTNGQDQEFDHNSPITLAVADNFHVSGTYISE